jgi:hypothetical protein
VEQSPSTAALNGFAREGYPIKPSTGPPRSRTGRPRDSVGSFGHLGIEAGHRRDIGQADRICPARTVFGGQRAVEDRPAVVDLTQPVAVRDADVAVVRDVSALTVDRVQALDLDARESR